MVRVFNEFASEEGENSAKAVGVTVQEDAALLVPFVVF